jgi:beta-phosphoglucomutase
LKQVEGCIFDLDNILVDSKGSTILPGVKRFLINLRVSGMKLAVASNKDNADNILNVLDIQNFFDVILDSKDETTNSVPLLLKTAKELGLAPENCVIFDNSSDMLNEAKILNMSCIGVGTNIPFNCADKTIPNLSEVNSSILKF